MENHKIDMEICLKLLTEKYLEEMNSFWNIRIILLLSKAQLLLKEKLKPLFFTKPSIPHKSLIEHLEVTNHATVLRDVLQKNINTVSPKY